MKTKELIKKLQDIDPSGETECVVGSSDIYFLAREPWYYDGKPGILIKDSEKDRKSYSVVGVKILGNGDKINFHCINIEDVLLDHPDAPVDYSELGEDDAKKCKAKHDMLREEYSEMVSNLINQADKDNK